MSGFQINETPLKHKNDESDQSPLETKAKKHKTLSLESEGEKMEFQQNQDHQNQNNEEGWKTAGPNRPARATKQRQQQPRQQHKLPAIKIQLTKTQVSGFSDLFKLKAEILRCKPEAKPDVIKFAAIKNLTLLIATDDPATHQALSQPWRTDAFELGVKIKEKEEKKDSPIRITIKGVDPSIDLSSQLAQQELAEQHVFNATRKMTKSNQPSRLIAATTDSKDSFRNLLSNGIRIGYNKFSVEPAMTVLQCFNCQETGHAARNCENQLRCLKCGGPHKHKECQESSYKCCNCEEPHAACSRSCSYLKSAKISQKVSSTNSYASVTSQQKPTPQNKPTQPLPPSPPPNEDALFNRLFAKLEAKMTTIMDEFMERAAKALEVRMHASMEKYLETSMNDKMSGLIDQVTDEIIMKRSSAPDSPPSNNNSTNSPSNTKNSAKSSSLPKKKPNHA
jgi:hypothetical protein